MRKPKTKGRRQKTQFLLRPFLINNFLIKIQILRDHDIRPVVREGGGTSTSSHFDSKLSVGQQARSVFCHLVDVAHFAKKARFAIRHDFWDPTYSRSDDWNFASHRLKCG